MPLEVYIKNGRIKVLLGVCKGKKQYDKRQDQKKRDAMIAEVFKLFMDLEHNTRVSAMANAYRGATASDVAVTTPAVETAAVGPDGRRGRILAGEETAEGALVRGH